MEWKRNNRRGRDRMRNRKWKENRRKLMRGGKELKDF
jgi:hypothetical protein